MKRVSSGSGWLANRGTSVKEGRKRVSFGLYVFSGSFGIRSIVLCKCSGNVLIGYQKVIPSLPLWHTTSHSSLGSETTGSHL